MKNKLICLFVCFVFVLPILFSCTEEPISEPKTKAKSYYEYFDTVSVVMSYMGDSQEEFSENCNAVQNLLSDYHKLFDIYYEYDGINNLKTINKNAGVAPVSVDEKLIDFLIYAKELYAITDGKTNILMGAVLKLWHDAREYGTDYPDDAYIPTEAELSEASQHTDISSLVINKEAGTVYISDRDASLDVGAIGKGYATNKAADLLRERGATSYVLNVGGNISAIGEKVSGNGWITGITNPDKTSDKSFVCRVTIKDISLVTSGDYERYYIVNGEKYHHVIDPDTNMPANYFSSVSIFTKDGGLADALSTALFCMSYEDGLKLIQGIGNIEVIWVYRDGRVVATDGLTLE